MGNINSFLRKINRIITLIGGAAISLMMIQVTLDVFFRFAINKPLPGTITIVAHYYMIIAIFLPLAYVEQTKSSICIELISSKFSDGFNKFLASFTNLFIAITGFLIGYVSYGVALKNFASKTSVMQGDYTIPTWPSYFVLCFSMFLLGTYCLVSFLMSFTSEKKQLETSDE